MARKAVIEGGKRDEIVAAALESGEGVILNKQFMERKPVNGDFQKIKTHKVFIERDDSHAGGFNRITITL